MDAFMAAEKKQKLPVDTLIEDVYDKMPQRLQRQRQDLRRHLNLYAEHYPQLKDHLPMSSSE